MKGGGWIRREVAIWRDPWHGLESCLERGGARALLFVLVGLAAGWWLYVPLHELLHALGCLAAGGTVSRLEIDPLYGGALLSSVVPFVVAGGEYAGRLSGFDTHGSDLVYLATDLAPYLLTLWPGWWALRRAGRSSSGSQAGLFGLSLPWALAPLISVTGDAYEIGSILVRHLPPWSEPAIASRLVGDDLPRKVGEIASGGPVLWSGLLLATLAGIAWAWSWMALAGFVATHLGQRPLSAAEPR